MNDRGQRELAAALSRLRKMESSEAFDAAVPTSRPTATQQVIFNDIGVVKHRYVRGGNQSGKTQVGGREASWVFAETHPTWKRPREWGDEPLLLIILGRTTKQIEETLWKKISGFLDPSSYTIQRQGGVIQKVVNKENGNTILFLSHHAENEAREKVQSFVAHYVWLDEMPGSYKLIEELHRRVQSRGGYFLATFTPKVMNAEIRRLVDGAVEPLARTYVLKAFDNPIYSLERKQEILSSLATMSEGHRRTVLDGDWLTGEEAVYHLDHDSMIKSPPNYEYGWRHVESVDPALKSALGLTVWAEDPIHQKWYCIKSEYIRGILDPRQLVETVRDKTKMYNIIRRISDPHEVWYIQTATKMVSPNYMGVYNKNSRKGELIKGFQDKLGDRLYIAPWCLDLIAELEECRWSETAENKIVNQHVFHLADTAQYFADNIPLGAAIPASIPVHQFLYEANQKRIEKKEQRMKHEAMKINRSRTW